MTGSFFSPGNFTPSLYLALFILGLLAIRHGIFADPAGHRRLLLGICAAATSIWAIAWWVLPHLSVDFVSPHLATQIHAGGGILDEQLLAFAYMAGITLLLAWRPAWQRGLSVLSFVGRMALTNYLLQAAIIDYASESYGLRLRVPPLAELPLAALIFTGLYAASRAWLAHHRYGPLEWAWRCVTYLRVVPLRGSAKAPSGS